MRIKCNFRIDGKSVDIEAIGFHINVNNKPAVQLIARDITRSKRWKKEMNRLERLNLIGEMATGIAHEMRNPMTTVRGFLQMLQGKQEFEKYNNYLDLMVNELVKKKCSSLF